MRPLLSAFLTSCPSLFSSLHQIRTQPIRTSYEWLFSSHNKKKKKMHGFSTVDGFMEVNEGLAEMIKYIANEPSVGLFYVQQHSQNAIPNLVHIKDKIVETSREITLHTEDSEDSIIMVRSMKECGFALADEMNKDIKRSLLMMSASRPKKGLVHNPHMDQMGRSSSWGPMAFTFTAGHAQKESGSNSGYLSTVLNSAKQKAAALRWPQLDPSPIGNPEGNKFATSITPSRWSTASETIPATETEADELPLSSQITEEQLEFPAAVAESSPAHDLPLTSDNYEKFKSQQEAKLKEWLEETKGYTESTEAK